MDEQDDPGWNKWKNARFRVLPMIDEVHNNNCDCGFTPGHSSLATEEEAVEFIRRGYQVADCLEVTIDAR